IRLLWSLWRSAHRARRGRAVSDADPAGEPEALVLVERQPEQRTALVRLNRPKQLNALNGPTMDALCAALEELDRDDAVRAMEMILTGEPMAAGEALARGLVSRVVPDELVVEDALTLASAIATKSPLALRLAKEAVNGAYEMSLTDGLAHERRLFYLLFASEDQKEGMAAFLAKRQPDFKGR